MDKIKCDTYRCLNAITHYHAIENKCYCEYCVLVICNTNEYEPLISVDVIIILMNLCQNILDDIRDYVSTYQLEMTWRLAFTQLKLLEADFSKVKIDFENSIDTIKPKELMQIKRRVTDLKTQIRDSEIFSKYLVHKELVRLRFRDADKDNEQFIGKTARFISEVNVEEEKIMVKNRLDKISHFLAPKSDVSKEIENFKLKHDEEINELKNKHKLDEIKYAKEKEDLLNQRNEIELELQKIKDQETEHIEDLLIISYPIN